MISDDQSLFFLDETLDESPIHDESYQIRWNETQALLRTTNSNVESSVLYPGAQNRVFDFWIIMNFLREVKSLLFWVPIYID
jgi:hypothetical protein